ncbi:DUF6301 family protein [Nocardia fluminea]|uniref:DUF6301 family protein n=1 Tax=Nocardia fluminea TaxID=134984 RepID=UPI0033EA3F83
MQADIEGAVRIANLAAGFDWTWTTDDLPRFCEAAGWSCVESAGDRGAEIQTDFDVEKPSALAVYNRSFLERNRRPDQQVTQLVLRVSDRVDGTLPENLRSLTDLFAELADRIATELGAPEVPSPGLEPEVRWSLPWSSISRWRNFGASVSPATAILFLAMTSQAVELRIVNLTYQRWWDDYMSRDDDDEDSGYDDDGEDLDDLPEKPRTWQEYSAALALTLTRLPLGGILVLRVGGRDVARIEPTWFGLTCQMLAQSVPRVQRDSGADQIFMIRNGWSVAEEGSTPEGWVRSLRWPALYREFDSMADAVVTALRSIYGVADPVSLVVDAWSDSSEQDPDITAFGIHSQ